MGVTPSTSVFAKVKILCADVCRRRDIGRSSLLSRDQEDNREYIRRNLTPCSRTHFATLEMFLFYYCLALPEYKQAHVMWQVVAVNFHLSFITVVFIRYGKTLFVYVQSQFYVVFSNKLD